MLQTQTLAPATLQLLKQLINFNEQVHLTDGKRLDAFLTSSRREIIVNLAPGGKMLKMQKPRF